MFFICFSFVTDLLMVLAGEEWGGRGWCTLMCAKVLLLWLPGTTVEFEEALGVYVVAWFEILVFWYCFSSEECFSEECFVLVFYGYKVYCYIYIYISGTLGLRLIDLPWSWLGLLLCMWRDMIFFNRYFFVPTNLEMQIVDHIFKIQLLLTIYMLIITY